MIYRSADNYFGVEISEEVITQVLVYVSKSKKKETGGILIGTYNKYLNCAIIQTISGPPTDSRSGHTWFVRGVRGLQLLINRCWEDRQYYVGEWHCHPGGTPDPSNLDINQMTEIANSGQYACPEPLLFIVGGNAVYYDCKAFVVLRNRQVIELQ